MNYRKIYMIIIKKALLEKRQKGKGIYYELHHILPKSLFPLWKTEKRNLVLLTAREHFFCHQLLTKIYNSYQMIFALKCFIMRKDLKISSKEYEKIRILFNQKIGNIVKNYIKNNQEKHKIKMRKVHLWWKNLEKRKLFSEKMHIRNLGKTAYTNGIKNINIFGNPPDDFYKGQTQNKNEELCLKRRKKCICNETKEVFNTTGELEKKYGRTARTSLYKGTISKRRDSLCKGLSFSYIEEIK